MATAAKTTDRTALIAHAESLDAEVAALTEQINRMNSRLSELRRQRDRAWDAADGVRPGDLPAAHAQIGGFAFAHAQDD